MLIIVQFSLSLRQEFYKTFRNSGMCKDDDKSRPNIQYTWNGIIDGHHSHHVHDEAIIRLRSSDKKWKGLQWFVCLVNSAHTVERYVKMAGFQNNRHDSSFFVKTTFYDLIHNLRIEYELLKIRKLRYTD